jgi:sorbose reductase
MWSSGSSDLRLRVSEIDRSRYNTNKEAETRAKEIEEEFGVKCRAFSVDTTDPQAVDNAITSQINEFDDRIDVFVYNSGVAWTSGASITGDLDNYHRVMKTNVDGLFYCARVVGRIWRDQKLNGLPNFRAGSFIATASMSGHIANFPQLQTSYDASKAAVKHMCQNLALEWVQFARVNSISPGYIATELTTFIPEATKEVWRHMIPMGREGQPGELAAAYLFLASDASSYCTGTDLLIDGKRRAQGRQMEETDKLQVDTALPSRTHIKVARRATSSVFVEL